MKTKFENEKPLCNRERIKKGCGGSHEKNGQHSRTEEGTSEAVKEAGLMEWDSRGGEERVQVKDWFQVLKEGGGNALRVVMEPGESWALRFPWHLYQSTAHTGFGGHWGVWAELSVQVWNAGWDFPGGPVVKNLPSSAEGTGSIPGGETKAPHATGQLTVLQLLSPHVLEPTGHSKRSLCTTVKTQYFFNF